MLSLFRGKHSSTFISIFFGLVLLAMVATGVGTQSGSMGSISSLLSGGDAIAKIGHDSIEPSEVSQRVQAEVENARAQQPEMTIQSFVAQGGFDGVIDQLIGDRALTSFGEAHGMHISTRAVDAKINDIQAFKGVDGKFDHNKFLSLIGQKHFTEAEVRNDFARDLMKAQMLVPVAGAAAMPKSVVAAYASLLLEVREGKIGIIPAAAMKNAPSLSDSAINNFYLRHAALYTMPERRVIEYVVYDKANFADAAKPTDAEIASYYQAHASDYAAKDLRALTQAIVSDEAMAKALADKVRGGTSLKDAAKAAGVEATSLAAQDKATYQGMSSADVANAAFSAARGHVADVKKSPLGWHVVQVDSATHDAGKSLTEARDGIIKTLSVTKIEEVFADFQNKVADKASAGAKFEDLVKANGGDVVTTPLVLANGASPDQPEYKPVAEMAGVFKDGFKPDTKTSSEPLLVAYGADRSKIALYHVRTIIAAGPVPLAKIHDQVAHDAQMDAASKLARVAAQDVVDKVNAGADLAQALKGTALNLPPIDSMKASKIELMAQQQQSHKPTPPPIREMFNVAPHHAKLVEADGHAGWFIIWLDKKTPGDASKNAQLLAGVQQQLGASYGQELVAQFTNATKLSIGATKYPSNINTLRASLVGNQGQ